MADQLTPKDRTYFEAGSVNSNRGPTRLPAGSMTRGRRVTRAVVAMLAAGCLAAPTATALALDQEPIVKRASPRALDLRSPDARGEAVQGASPRSQDLRSPDTRDTAVQGASPRSQDLRSPDTRDTAVQGASPRSQDLRSPDTRDTAVQGASPRSQDLRSPDTRDTAVQALSSAPKPQPAAGARASGPAGGAEGSDWPAILLGVGGVTLFAGGLALTARAHTLRRAARPTA